MLPFDVARATHEAAPGITVAGLSRPAQPWTLRLFPQGLRLTPEREGEPPIHILRSELATHVDLVDFGFARRTIAIRKPKKRLFKLDPAGVIQGGNPWWLVLAVLQLMLARSGVSLFRDLSTKPPP